MIPYHSEVVEEVFTIPLPKSPIKDTFPSECLPGCGRNCKQFYQVHTKLISFALYATQDPAQNPREICAYAFSCGNELMGEKFTLEQGETPVDLIHRVVPALLNVFVEAAVAEKENNAVRDN
jgi:hypothetical protein